MKLPNPDANRIRATEFWAERTAEAAGKDAKQQVGSFDPEMGSVKAGFVAGERKAVASVRSHLGSVAARQEALKR